MKEKFLFYNEGKVPSEIKQKMLHQKGCVFWLVGRSGSGKTTIAIEVEKELTKQGYFVSRLDGDNIRTGLCSDLGFSIEDRRENIRRISEVAKILCDIGVVVIIGTISPTEEIRDMAKSIVGEDRYYEIFVSASKLCCQKRDTKGLYHLAQEGKLSDFQIPYQEPNKAHFIVHTDQEKENESIRKVLGFVEHTLQDLKEQL